MGRYNAFRHGYGEAAAAWLRTKSFLNRHFPKRAERRIDLDGEAEPANLPIAPATSPGAHHPSFVGSFELMPPHSGGSLLSGPVPTNTIGEKKP